MVGMIISLQTVCSAPDLHPTRHRLHRNFAVRHVQHIFIQHFDKKALPIFKREGFKPALVRINGLFAGEEVRCRTNRAEVHRAIVIVGNRPAEFQEMIFVGKVKLDLTGCPSFFKDIMVAVSIIDLVFLLLSQSAGRKWGLLISMSKFKVILPHCQL